MNLFQIDLHEQRPVKIPTILRRTTIQPDDSSSSSYIRLFIIAYAVSKRSLVHSCIFIHYHHIYPALVIVQEDTNQRMYFLQSSALFLALLNLTLAAFNNSGVIKSSTNSSLPTASLLAFASDVPSTNNSTVSSLTTASLSNVLASASDVPSKNNPDVIKLSTNSSLTNASASNFSQSAADYFESQSDGVEQ